ncbi:hypothetical protein STEG23_031155 [Scotinomys teguina]
MRNCGCLFIWCITLTDFRMLNHPCICGIKPNWSWWIMFLMCSWSLFANILLSIFASMFMREIALNLIISLCLFLLGDFASSSSRAFSFNLVDLSTGESGMLKSPTINVWGLMLESSF